MEPFNAIEFELSARWRRLGESHKPIAVTALAWRGAAELPRSETVPGLVDRKCAG
jgi:hypothetical protein